MTTRIIVDAQLPPGLAAHLVEAGWDAVHVAAIRLLAATDQEIWAAAIDRDAAIMSKDEDFVIDAIRQPTGPQIVWIRFGNVRNPVLWSRISAVLGEIATALHAGERIIEIT